jgi:4-amino-4-deoxy-L-arabinose transferase-like glycosyltransferase
MSIKINSRELFLWAVLLLGIFIALSTEILGFFNLLNRFNVITIWLLLFIIILFKFFSLIKIITTINFFKNLLLNLPIFILLIFFGILFFTFLVAVIYPPNTWDSMTYHMPRVMHWIQNHNINFYPTSNTRQLIMPPFSQYVILHLYFFTNTDNLANLVQWFSMLSSLIGISLITKELGGNKTAQVISSLFCITLPMGILQSTSTQTDYVVSLWIVIMVYFFFRYLSNKKLVYIFGFGMALSIGILTKQTTYIFALPFCLWLFFYILKKKKSDFFYLLIIPLIIILLNFGHFSRNFNLYKNPIGTHSENVQATNKEYGINIFVSNVIRNLSLNISFPKKEINDKTSAAIVLIHKYIDISVNDSKNTFGNQFYIPFSFYDSTGPNTLHFLIIILLIFLLFVNKKFCKLDFYYFFSIFSGFLLFSLILKWQPYGNRLMLPLFVLSSSFVGFYLFKLQSKFLSYTVIFLLLLNSMPYILMNKTRPLIGSIKMDHSSYTPAFTFSSFWTANRSELYFMARPDLYKLYEEVSIIVKNQNCKVIDLKMGDDGWEYPFWVLIKQDTNNSLTKFFHADVSNISRTAYLKNNKNVESCALISLIENASDDKIFKSQFVNKISKPPVYLYY